MTMKETFSPEERRALKKDLSEYLDPKNPSYGDPYTAKCIEITYGLPIPELEKIVDEPRSWFRTITALVVLGQFVLFYALGVAMAIYVIHIVYTGGF